MTGMPSIKSLINDTKPGRPRRVKSSPSTVVVRFRVTATEARAVQRIADKRGVSVGELARASLLGAVRR